MRVDRNPLVQGVMLASAMSVLIAGCGHCPQSRWRHERRQRNEHQAAGSPRYALTAIEGDNTPLRGTLIKPRISPGRHEEHLTASVRASPASYRLGPRKDDRDAGIARIPDSIAMRSARQSDLH